MQLLNKFIIYSFYYKQSPRTYHTTLVHIRAKSYCSLLSTCTVYALFMTFFLLFYFLPSSAHLFLFRD